jgi:hypothetical protein
MPRESGDAAGATGDRAPESNGQRTHSPNPQGKAGNSREIRLIIKSPVKYSEPLALWAVARLGKYLPLQERLVDQLDFLQIERWLWA